MPNPPRKKPIVAGDEDNEVGAMPPGGVRSSRHAPEDEEAEGSPTPGLIAATSLYVEVDGRYHINFDDERKKSKVKGKREAFNLLVEYFKEKLDLDDDE